MKIKINQFNQTQGVEVEFPCEIKGKNGTGKSTVIRALHYVLGEKDPYPQEGFNDDYSGCYSEAAITPEQLFLSVELSHNGTTLRRESRPTSAQLKSFYETKNQIFSVENTFFIDDVRCTKAVEYSTKLSEMFGENISMLLSASKFFKMKPTEKLEFVCKTLGLNSEVGGTSEALKSAKSNLRKQANELDTIIKTDTLRIAERQKFKAEYSEKQAIAERLKSSKPTFTDAQISENNEIYRQISELENKKPHLLNRLEKIDTSKIAELKRTRLMYEQANLNYQHKVEQNLARIKSAENSEAKLAELATLEAQIALMPDFANFEEYVLFRSANSPVQVNIEDLPKTAEILQTEKVISETKSIIENYETLVKSAKCTKCNVCTLSDCSHREVSYMDLEFYTEKLKKDETELNRLNSEVLDSERKRLYRADYLNESNELLKIKAELARKRSELNAMPNVVELEEMNAKFLSEFKSKSLEIERIDFEISELTAKASENAKIDAENALIDEKNKELVKVFNEEITAQIEGLKSKLHVLEISDNTDVLKSLESELEVLAKEIGALELSERELEKNKTLSKSVYSELAVIDGKLINETKDFINNLITLENQINEQIIPYGFECSLLSLTKGGEATCEFRLNFMGERYQSEAFRLLRNAKFCAMLAEKLGSELPIFIDESQKIVNDEILSEVKQIKNICLISADKNYNVLTINKL